MRVTVIPFVINVLETIPKGLEEKKRGNIDYRKDEDHPDSSIVNIHLNILKIPEHLKRLGVTRNLVKDHQLTLARKTQTKWNTNVIALSHIEEIVKR